MTHPTPHRQSSRSHLRGPWLVCCAAIGLVSSCKPSPTRAPAPAATAPTTSAAEIPGAPTTRSSAEYEESLRAACLATRASLWTDRVWAIESLSGRFPSDQRAHAAIAAAVDDPVADVRRAAREALQRLLVVEPSPQERTVVRARLDRLVELARIGQSEDLPRIERSQWTIASPLAGVTTVAPRSDPAFAAWVIRQIDTLRNATESTEAHIRACDALADAGPRAVAAAPTLIALLGREQRPLRDHAYAALRAFGANAAPSLLIGAATANDTAYPLVAQLLGELGEAPTRWVSVLAAKSHDPDPYVRQIAIRSLGAIGPAAGEEAVKAVRAALTDPALEVRCRALDAAQRVRPKEDLSAAFAAILLDAASEDERQLAIRMLLKLPPSDFTEDRDGVVMALGRALWSPYPDIRSAARRTIARIGEDGAPAVRVLLARLRAPPEPTMSRGQDEAIRFDAAGLLLENPKLLRLALPEMTKMLADPGGAPPDLAEWFFRRAGTPGLEELGRALESQDSDARVRAAALLSELKPEDERSRNVLASILKDRSAPGAARELAAEALARDSAAPARAALAGAAADSDPQVRRAAVEALGRADPASRPSPSDVPALVAILASDDNVARLQAASLLGRTGPAAAEAIAALTRMAGNRLPHVRRAAVEALMQIDPGGQHLTAALMATVMSGDAESAQRLAPVVSRSETGQSARARLTEIAGNDPDPAIRRAATMTLEKLPAD